MNTVDAVAGAAAHAEKPSVAEPEESKTGVITLTIEERLSLELISTKRKLADAELKLALQSLKEAQRKSTVLTRDQAVILTRLAHQHGLGPIKAVRFVDGTQIAYELE